MKKQDKEEKVSLKQMLKNLKPLLKYFKPHKKNLIIATSISIIATILGAFWGYFCGAIIESTISGDYKHALFMLFINTFVIGSSEILYNISTYFFTKAQIAIARTLGYETYKKSMNLPAYAFEEMSSGKIINVITQDTETVIGSIEQVVDIIGSLFTSLGVFIYILFHSWEIALEIVVLVAVFTASAIYYTKLQKELRAKRKKENDKFTTLANETIRGIREIKTLGIKNNLLSNSRDMIKVMYASSMKEAKNNRNYRVTSSAFYVIMENGTFLLGLILLARHNLSTTFYVSLSYYIYRFLNLFQNMTSLSTTITSLGVSFERITDIVENRKYKDVKFGKKDLKEVKGILEFKDVTFGYPNEELLLEDFNIKFDTNKKIAVVGASGGGKSTLFNLITRLFEPTKGNILLDEVNIKDLTEESLRKHISIIRQDPFLFNRTIKENFTVIDENVDLETIRKYCEIACIDEYIMSLPDKYDTVLGEGGVNLSGGQKQRLAIARTLLKQSKVILLDEATSALDNESQEYIKKSIDELAKDHTVVIVAHRLSTIIDADIIYVIKNGKVIAKGKHDKLMTSCEYYRTLYQTEDNSN